ncbi:MAG: hypothetical protein WDO17_18400 [Alphaproteobacteria bacterium]
MFGTVFGTVGGWLVDDWVKPPIVAAIDDTAQKYVPWDWPVVQMIAPNSTAFAATKVDGCSNGNLARLVGKADSLGLRFTDKKQVADAYLCQNWKYTGTPRGILEAMAIRFDQCFAIVQHAGEKTFEIRAQKAHVCRTEYAENKDNNEWEKKPGTATLLCVEAAVGGPLSTTEPFARMCSDKVLSDVGITARTKKK